MYINEQKAMWDSLYHQSRFHLKYPNESIVRFVRTHFAEGGGHRILDLGSGTGRHVLFLAQEGQQAVGIDFSQVGIDYTRDAVSQLGFNAELVQGSILDLPFENESFDGLISYGVIYYFYKNDIKQIIKEVHRVLKPGATAFFMVRTTRDKRFGQGELVEPNTYKMATNFSNEEGMIIHFFDEAEIKEAFAGFSSLKLGFIEESYDSMDTFNSDFLVTVTK